MEQLVIHKAKELFFSYGLKSVSMDDLAKMAGVSKKTIYQSVSDKAELVGKVVDELIRCHKEQLANAAVADNAIEEVHQQLTTTFVTLASVSTNFFYELEKFFPVAWQRVLDHKATSVLPAILKNLKRGVEEEVYREDIDSFFVAHVRLQQIATALNPGQFYGKKVDAQQLMKDLTIFYLHGIVTTKGKKLINKYFKEQ